MHIKTQTVDHYESLLNANKSCNHLISLMETQANETFTRNMPINYIKPGLFLNKCNIKISYRNSYIMLLKTWKVIKLLFSSSQSSSTTPDEIKYNGNLITSSETISESFNSYFSEVFLDLSTKFNQHDTNSFIQ